MFGVEASSAVAQLVFAQAVVIGVACAAPLRGSGSRSRSQSHSLAQPTALHVLDGRGRDHFDQAFGAGLFTLSSTTIQPTEILVAGLSSSRTNPACGASLGLFEVLEHNSRNYSTV
jgi:hypothetical protein